MTNTSDRLIKRLYAENIVPEKAKLQHFLYIHLSKFEKLRGGHIWTVVFIVGSTRVEVGSNIPMWKLLRQSKCWIVGEDLGRRETKVEK